MKKRNLLTTTLFTALSSVMLMTACSEGEDSPAGDGDGDVGGGTGDGDTGGGAGDGDGDTGGTVGDGDGDTGTGGMTGGASVTFTFDTDLDGLIVDYEENLEGLGMGGSSSSSLSHEPADGLPDNGSAKLESPFDYTGDGEFDNLQKAHVAIPLDAPLDFTGGMGSVNVKLVSGGSASEECPVVAKMFLKTTDAFVWGNGMEGNLEEGAWVSLSIDASAPSYTDEGYDASDVRMVGVEVTPNTGDGCVSTDVVVLLDTFTL